MPLKEETVKLIHGYCIKHLEGGIEWHVDKFSFIKDEELKKRLGRAFYTARYNAKLMEALNFSGDELHFFIKFQIIQYAAIYECVISHMLFDVYKDDENVIKLKTHKSYKPVDALGKKTIMKFNDEDLYTCVYRDSKTPQSSISFRDKVDCAVKIGFLAPEYSEEIKELYALRNLAHIENEAEKK